MIRFRIGSGRAHLLPLLVIVVVASASCEEKKSGRSLEAAESSSPAVGASAFGVDAGILGEPIDPPPPAGDLKAEIERFSTLESCIAERAKLDPLVGDALGALGYETFLRDACRLLEAAKYEKRETCDLIDASALRSRCQSWVAMVSQAPDACPMQFEGLVSRGRSPSCVAVAAKDPRLCAGEARTAARSTCAAMVLRDAAKCEGLLPNQRSACQREVARWKSVLAPPLEGLEKLPLVVGKLVVRGASGTPDPKELETDISPDFSSGSVVVTSRDGMKIELGSLVSSEGARIATAPQKKARAALALLASPGKKDELRPSLQKLELELPGEAPIVSPPAPCDCTITVARVPDRRGGEVRITLVGTLHGLNRNYSVSLDVQTFVRDVVRELGGAEVKRR